MGPTIEQIIDERRLILLARIREGTIDKKNPTFAIALRFAAGRDVVTPTDIFCALRAGGRGRPEMQKTVRGSYTMWLYDGFNTRRWQYAPGALTVAFDRIAHGKYSLRQEFREAVAAAAKG